MTTINSRAKSKVQTGQERGQRRRRLAGRCKATGQYLAVAFVVWLPVHFAVSILGHMAYAQQQEQQQTELLQRLVEAQN